MINMLKIMFISILVLFIGVPATYANSRTIEIDSELKAAHSPSAVETTFSLAKYILTNYYEKIDLDTDKTKGRDFIDTILIDPKLSKYIEQKINTKQYVVEAVNGMKENYHLDFTLLSSKLSNNGVFLTISTEATFNYIGLDIESGFGEVSTMFFETTGAGFTLADWYMLHDY